MLSTRKRRWHLPWSLLLVTATACAGDAPGGDAISATRDSSGVVLVVNDLSRATARCVMDSLPLVSIGTGDGDEQATLFRVQGARLLSDGGVAVVNSGTDEVRWYGPDGAFRRAAGRKGRGPGEFENAFTVHWRPGDTLSVGDYPPMQFLVFSPEGAWVRSIALTPAQLNSPRQMHLLADGRWVLGIEQRERNTPPGTFVPRALDLMLHDANGVRTDSITRLDNGRWGQTVDDPTSVTLNPWFESFPAVATGGDRLVLGHASRSELRIHRVSDAVQLERVVRWNGGDRRITDDDVAFERDRTARQYADVPEAMRARLVDPLLSARRPVADSFPAFGQLRVGRDGRLWIREYPRPRDTLLHRWIAFAPDGTFDCRRDTPRFDRIEEFDAEQALVYTRDTLGVERVARYRVRRP